MKTYKILGSVIGSLLGATVAGVSLYFGKSVFAGIILIIGLATGSIIGNLIKKRKNKLQIIKEKINMAFDYKKEYKEFYMPKNNKSNIYE